MALSCNSFTANTVQSTQLTLGCTPEPANLHDSELHEELFLLTVLDALERLDIGTALAEYAACDGADAARAAFCAINGISAGPQNPPAKIKAAILLKLNEALCD
jgi:hypothetical protein